MAAEQSIHLKVEVDLRRIAPSLFQDPGEIVEHFGESFVKVRAEELYRSSSGEDLNAPGMSKMTRDCVRTRLLEEL